MLSNTKYRKRLKYNITYNRCTVKDWKQQWVTETSFAALIQSSSRCNTVLNHPVRVSSCGLCWCFSAGYPLYSWLPAQTQFRPKRMAWQEKCQPLLNPHEPGFLLQQWNIDLHLLPWGHSRRGFALTVPGINGQTHPYVSSHRDLLQKYQNNSSLYLQSAEYFRTEPCLWTKLQKPFITICLCSVKHPLHCKHPQLQFFRKQCDFYISHYMIRMLFTCLLSLFH